jgi:hypothetical protein
MPKSSSSIVSYIAVFGRCEYQTKIETKPNPVSDVVRAGEISDPNTDLSTSERRGLDFMILSDSCDLQSSLIYGGGPVASCKLMFSFTNGR